MNSSFEIYQKAILYFCPEMTDSDWNGFKSGLKTTRISAKDYFIQTGELQPYLGFVVKGLLRSFYISPKGQEIITFFVKEGQYASDYPNFLTQSPTLHNFQCLEDIWK